MSYAHTADGLRIYFESGVGEAPVVLLHPVRASARSFVELGFFDALQSHGLRPIALDARGFGASDDPDSAQQLGPESAVRDVSAVLDALGVERAHVLGYSLGAAFALRFAMAAPQRVDKLVLGGLSRGPLAQLGFALGLSVPEMRARAQSQLAQVRVTEPRLASYLGLVRSLFQSMELEPLLGAALPHEILGVYGSADRLGPADVCRELRESGARLREHVVSAADHGGCFSHPEFRQVACDFLAR